MKKKLVLVTGASRGLGLSIVKSLLLKNYTVITTARGQTEEISNLLEQYPEQLAFEPFDMANTSEIKAFSTMLTKKYGRLYALINNAALGNDGVLATMHESDISTLIKVNIEAPILLSKYLSRGMLINQNGRIINISSIISKTGYSGLSVYGATKAAMNGLTKSLARELGKANVTVNAVLPGYMTTDMTSGLQGDKLDKIKRRSPLGSLASTQHVSEMVTFLLSDAGDSITGSEFTVDSGSTA